MSRVQTRLAPLVAGVSMIVTAALFASDRAAADIIEQILVKVNGEIITKTDLEQRQVAALRQRNQRFNELTDDQLRQAIAGVTPQVIVDAVDELLLIQRARELGYRLTDEQFKGILENIKKENRLESEEQFQAALKQEGLTLADLRRTLERQALIVRVQQAEVLGKIGMSEEEAQRYYAEHRSEFTTPATITLREILVEVATDSRGINVAADEAAQAAADTARARVVAGEDFAKVAAEVSTAPSKANGGLIGPFENRDLAQAVRQIVEGLSVGGISEVIRTPRGYQILKLESATEVVVQSIEQARDQIAEKVFEGKRQAESRKYLKRLREQAIIEWKHEELKKAYEQRLAEIASSAGEQPGQ